MAYVAPESQKPGLLDHPVSLFQGAFKTDVLETLPLGTVLQRIKDGTYHDAITHVRQQKVLGKAAYTKAKDALLAFTPCCALHTRAEKVPWSEKLISTTGLVHYDFDHVADTQALKAQLASNPSTVFAFLSPGGDGVKVGITATGITDVDTYKYPWHVVLRRLKKTFAEATISEDTHIKYLHALCFVSDDPDLYCNPDAVPLVIPAQAPDEEAPFPDPETPAEAASAPPYATVVQALPHIPCEDYDTWWRVGLSLKRGGQPWARASWDAWSQQSTKYDHASQQKKWDEFPADGTIHAYSVLTIAAEHGWRPAGGGEEQAESINHVIISGNAEAATHCNTSSKGLTTSNTLTTYYPWPTLAPEALYGVAGDYVKAIAPHTESDPAALLAQLLTVAGVNMGRQRYCVLDGVHHFPNLFVVIAGLTARARKGTSYRHIERQVQAVDPSWGLANHIKGCGSGEGLIYAVRDARWGKEAIKEKGRVVEYQEVELDAGVEDKRALYQTGEFSGLLKVAAREGNTLSEVLRDCWDTGYLRNATKAHPLEAHGAHIGVVGHITVTELQKLLTSTDMANGFGNRFLWVCAKRSRLLPRGGNLTSVEFTDLRRRLGAALAFGKRPGEMQLDEQADVAWDAVYRMLSEDGTGLADTLLARAEPQVMRLAMLYAILDQSATMCLPHLNAALALWEYTEDSATYIFGQALGDATADTILHALDRAGSAGLSHNAIVQDVFHRNLAAAEATRALHLLEKLGRIVTETRKPEGGRGRPSTVYTLRRYVVNVVDVVNQGRYVTASNDAVNKAGFFCGSSQGNYVVNPPNGSEPTLEPPAVPDMTGGAPDGVPFTIPENGYKPPLREPGYDTALEMADDDEEGLIV